MAQNLLNKYNYTGTELFITALFSISGILLGIFLSSYDIYTHAYFLDYYNSLDLALAYLFSGFAGIIVFYVYSMTIKWLRFKFFVFINYLIVLATAIAYFYLHLLYPDNQLISFFGLVAMFVVNILLLLTFWRHARKVYQAYQRKRMFGLIEVSVILGIVFGSFGITGGLLFYSYVIIPLFIVGSIILVFIFHFLINIVHRKNKFLNQKKERYIPVGPAFTLLFSSKYTSLLFSFVFLSSAIGFLLHYGFITETRNNFPHIIGMSKFYGLYIGCMYIFILIVEKLLIHRILYSYDSPFSLILMPALVTLTIILALTANFFYHDAEALSRFGIFFILIGITKVGFESSKYSIQVPSLRVLFKTLDVRYLQIIFPRIEGSIVMIGMIAAGGTVVGMSFLPFYSIDLILVAGLLLGLIWLFFSYKLVKAYQNALKSNIKKIRMSHSQTKTDSFEEKIRRLLVLDRADKVENALKISKQIQPLTYEADLKRMISHPQKIIKQYVINIIRNENLIHVLPDLKTLYTTTDDSTKELLDPLITYFKERSALIKDEEVLQHKLNSSLIEEKLLAAELLGSQYFDKHKNSLINLTREIEPELKLAAIRSLSRLSNPEHSYILIEFLNSPDFYAYAFEALVKIGDDALEYLERAFITPGISEKVRGRIVRIYGRIGSTRAVELLLGKLDNQNRYITDQAVMALVESKFQASSMNVNYILNLLVKTIGVLAFNLQVYTTLRDKKQFNRLCDGFKFEIEENYNLVFRLLGLAYNSNTINSIYMMITRGSKNDISHAIELLDEIVYDDVKLVLLPIIENISDIDKVKQLQYYFPIESQSTDELLSSILTRDYNNLSTYPRACAMLLFLNNRETKMINELAFNLYHPNFILRQTAAYVLNSIDSELLQQLLDRMPSHESEYIIQSLYEIENGKEMLLVDKLAIIKNQERLALLDEEVQIEFAQNFEALEFKKNQQINIEEELGGYDLLLFLSGKAMCYFDDTEMIIPPNEIIYNELIKNSKEKTLTFISDSLIFAISKEKIKELIFDYSDLAGCLLKCVEEFRSTVPV